MANALKTTSNLLGVYTNRFTGSRHIYCFILLSLLGLNTAFAANCVEVLNTTTHLHTTGYFKTHSNLSLDQVLSEARKASQNKPSLFSALPKNSISFGFDDHDYWFLLEVSRSSLNEPQFIDLKNYSASSVDIYAFDDTELRYTEHTSDTIPISERKIKSLSLRFELLPTTNTITYLINVSSINPHFVGFSIGNRDEVDVYWNINYLILLLSLGAFLSLFIYNLFIFIITKERAYIYYLIYTSSLFLFVIIAKYSYAFSNEVVIHALPIISFVNLVSMFGLIFFTISFLNIKGIKVKIIFYSLIAIQAIFSALLALSVIDTLYTIPIIVAILYTLYLSVVRYMEGYKLALIYLFSTGIGLLMIAINVFMIQGVNSIPYNVITSNLPLFSVSWDMITLSIALAYRINLLKRENQQKEYLLMMQSRQQSMGNIAGNVAHQWRQPLAALGAILSHLEAKLRYTQPTKDELLEPIHQSQEVLQHLSQTVNTFQGIFKQEDASLQQVDTMIQRVIALACDNLSDHQIKLNYTKKSDAYICVNYNEFAQVLLVLLENAQNILTLRGIKNPEINISLDQIDKEVIIKVSDNAGGILIEPVSSIFEPFVTDQEQGTGRGLFIAKMIIEKNLKGNITARNDKNGAVFTIAYCAGNL